MSDTIRTERNKLIDRALREHRIGEVRTVRPVSIEVEERTGRFVYPGQFEGRGPRLERWTVAYSNGETRTYERLEP